MTTVYLHIGNPKTGTTLIQYFFFKHRRAFLKQGLLYPIDDEHNGKEKFAHTNLSEALIQERNTKKNEDKPPKRIDDWEKIYQEIHALKPKYALISAENIAKLTFDEIILIKNYLSDFILKIIVYLRRQDEFLLSSHSKQVKLIRYIGSIQEYYSKNKNRCDYYKLLESWRKVLGKENLIIRIFEPNKFKNGVIGDFLECLDFNPEESQLNISKKMNINLDRKTIKVIQLLNKILTKSLSLSSEACKKIFIRHILKNGKIDRIISKIPDWLISNDLFSENERLEIV